MAWERSRIILTWVVIFVMGLSSYLMWTIGDSLSNGTTVLWPPASSSYWLWGWAVITGATALAFLIVSIVEWITYR